MVANFDTTCTNAVTCNEPNSVTDPRGNVTNYTYDAIHGGVTRVTKPAPTGVPGSISPELRYSYTQLTSSSGDVVYMTSWW